MGNHDRNRVLNGSATGTLTNAAGHTIQGAGQLGVNLIGLVNQGLILANQPTPLVIDPSAAGLINTGTLRATSGGTLQLTGNVGSFNNTGGTIEALAGSQVVFQSGAVVTNLTSNVLNGGIWKAESVGGSSATIDFQGTNTYIALTNSTADIYLIGPNSVIQARSVSGAIQSLDSTLFDNAGALRLQQGRTFVATGGSGNFTNESTGLLELSDSAFQSNNLTSSGTVRSFGNSTITIATNFNNRGTVDLQTGILTLSGSGTNNLNTGTIFTGTGTLRLAGGTLSANTPVTIPTLSKPVARSPVGAMSPLPALRLSRAAP